MLRLNRTARPADPRGMGLRVTRVRGASREEWDAVWSRCAWSTFSQGRAWAELWQRHAPERPRPRARWVEFSDGAVAILPLSVAPLARGLLLRHLAPAGSFGGWLSTDGLSRCHVRLLGDVLVQRLGDVDFRLSPFAPHVDAPGLPRDGSDETRVVDLRAGFAEARRAWTKGHRSAVGQALREGIEVSPARTPHDWLDYFGVYRETRTRWGDRARSDHRPALFRALSELPPSRVRLWLARFEGRVVAGAVCLEAGVHVAYWHGAALASSFPKRPVHLLLHEAMRDAAARGLRWFDLGPSGGLDGVERFKRGFGARSRVVPRLRCSSRAARLAAHARRWLVPPVGLQARS